MSNTSQPFPQYQLCEVSPTSPCLQVYTFGCNDEGALGRTTDDPDDESVPEKVELPVKVTQVTAGDSHTAALTEEGHVYVWGTFRVSCVCVGHLQGELCVCGAPSG